MLGKLRRRRIGTFVTAVICGCRCLAGGGQAKERHKGRSPMRTLERQCARDESGYHLIALVPRELVAKHDSASTRL
jgi:hypothetical protein